VQSLIGLSATNHLPTLEILGSVPVRPYSASFWPGVGTHDQNGEPAT
jgi:hypothetical protein